MSESMRPVFESFYRLNIGMWRDVCKDWTCGVLLEDLLSHWPAMMIADMFSLVQRRDDRFNVLCHGDLWSNNVMFKYDDESGQVIDCVMLDYQMCNFNSPAFDLHYVFVTSLNRELKTTETDHFIQFYHAQLVACLQKLNFQGNPPTLLALQMDCLATGAYGLEIAFGIFAVALAERSNESEMKNLFEDSAEGHRFRKRLYSNPRYVEAMEQLVPYFYNKGYLQWVPPTGQ